MRRFAPFAALLAAVLIATPALASNDPFFSQQWGMQKIKAEEAWVTSAGVGSNVAIVDTGVDLGHEDLQKIGAGWDFVSNDSVPQDEKGDATSECSGNFGHGSHVAGIAAATANNGRGIAGVAPAAKIMPVRVLNQHGCGTFEDVIEGIRWAADNGAQVVNLSLGAEVQFLLATLGQIQDFFAAIEYAWQKGAVVAVAAGNERVFPSGYGNINAIVVGATDENDGKAAYSNLGDAKWSLMAPGSNILSSVPGGYAKASGTSMATPHVAGAAAVLRCAGLNKQQTVDKLLSSADDLGISGRDPIFGSGRLNLARAVQGLSASTCKVSGLGVAPSGSSGSASGSGGSTRRSSGSRSSSSPAAAGPAQPAPESPPSPSPTETARAEALGAESAQEEGGGNLLLNVALLFLVLVSGVALYVWNYWRTSRS